MANYNVISEHDKAENVVRVEYPNLGTEGWRRTDTDEAIDSNAIGGIVRAQTANREESGEFREEGPEGGGVGLPLPGDYFRSLIHVGQTTNGQEWRDAADVKVWKVSEEKIDINELRDELREIKQKLMMPLDERRGFENNERIDADEVRRGPLDGETVRLDQIQSIIRFKDGSATYTKDEL